MTFTVPESVKQYFDKNGSVKAAVDDIVSGIDGKAKSGLSRDEARQYNKAILIAAKVRHDFVDMLFELWKATWGEALGRDFDAGPFESNLLSIDALWKEGWIWEWAYRPGDESKDVNFYYLRFSKKGISLLMDARKVDETPIKLNVKPREINWQWEQVDELWYAASEERPLKRFFDGPDSVIQDLVADARKAKALLEKS